MRKAKIILSVLCLIAGITACSQEDDSFLNLQNIDGEINILGSDGKSRHIYRVEVAENMEDMYHGLMGRTSLDENSGFLFDASIVPADVEVAMWMKDTLIPLDMIFADEKGEIFYIHENAKPNDLSPIYPPKRPRVILEINGGQSRKNHIKVGDIINIK